MSELNKQSIGFGAVEKAEFNEKSNIKAILISVGQIFVYLICLVGAITDYSLVINSIFSIYLGLVIGQLFVIGHDACHQSLAKSSLLNKIIGRLALSWTLHSYTLWHLEHNVKHHSRTNIMGGDPSWSPFTKKEFDRQSRIRKTLERFYRSPFGAGAYYMIEMWLKIHSFPIKPDVRSEWKKHLSDSLLIVIAFLIQLCLVVYFGTIFAPSKPLVIVLLLGWIIPFLSWNWLMGFAIYLHHTHPDIPWFTENEKLTFSAIQTLVTIHVIFPDPLQALFYNIMEHTAHHLQPSIPMYNLYFAQKQLEEVYSNIILSYRWSIKEYLRITRICKLFDPENNCWTDFNGNQTSDIIPRLREKHLSTDLNSV